MEVSIWRKVAVVSEVPPGEIKGVDIENHQVALYNIEGRFYATDNICTHAFALMSDGWIEGDHVLCPLHAGRFEIATGKAMGDPVDCNLKIYPVRLSGEDVEVCV